jgi:2-dehydro-3-deoxyphosphogluconate aldolase/(4S)-4-hydroxy-2-oxoglutarate aldolase
MKTIAEHIYNLGVVPVVAIEDERDASALGEALVAGGLPCAEITFRTAAALPSIQVLSKQVPDILVGAGTVLSVDQARMAVDRGAEFLVTPGFDEQVVSWCVSENIPVFPGVSTPTEINMALRFGLNILKFFPAEAFGGIRTLKAIAGPYPHLRFIPTGGINAQNLSGYLSLPAVLACGGSWLVAKTMISNKEFEGITAKAREAVQIVARVRSR